MSMSNLWKQGECFLNIDLIPEVQGQCKWKDWHTIILNATFLQKNDCLKHPTEDLILTIEKKKSVQMLKSDFYCKFGKKIMIFTATYC